MIPPAERELESEAVALPAASAGSSAESPRWAIWRYSIFSEERVFLLLAIVIGFISGAAVVCFRIAIEWLRVVMLGSALAPSHARAFLSPLIAGLIVAVLVIHFFPRTSGSGVNQTKAALYIYDGYIGFRVAVGKFIVSSLAIGSGFSLGPEDPGLQIGATIASVCGRSLRLSRERLRLIAPIGAAAGLAAAFSAPVSAVLFVIEEVIGQWSAEVFGAIVLSATTAAFVARWFFGSEPLFRIPPVEFRGVEELLAYAALGIIGGLASVVFARLIASLRLRAKNLPHWTRYFQPAAAALILGLIAWLGFPQVMGAGYEIIDQAMHDRFTWETLGILAGLKIVATTVSFVSGTPGGMFAPTLFIGAMLGASVGGVERMLIPHLTGTIGTYALVGMGVLFAGFLRAPMTSVFMVLEVSGNYSIIVPVMIANTLSYLISRSLQPVPIFELLTLQDGLELPSMEEQREQPVLRVEDAMRPAKLPVLSSSATIAEAISVAEAAGAEDLMVDDRPNGWAATTLFDLRKSAEEQPRTEPLYRVLSPQRAPHLHPDHRLEVALYHVKDWRLLPVIHRADKYKLVGIIALEDILEAYDRLQPRHGE
ncbi:MAG: chloride channel protein [Acidobacteriaceae bacterium]